MSIYKSYGIRGDATSELSIEYYRRWGAALGRSIEPGAKFVVGGDVRESTPDRLAALVEGLSLAGADCIDLGQLPTPMVQYAQRRLQASGYAVVTACNDPAPFNGLRWMIGNESSTARQIQALEQAAACPPTECPDRPAKTPRTLDISFDYVAWLQETWCDALRAKHHIVLDAMHGCLAGRARRYLHAIFPECLISVIHDDVDPEFCGLRPDCSDPEGLVGLSEAVYRERAQLGIAFDGDGDRIALVDQRGVALTAEETTWILLKCLGRRLRDKPFVYDLEFSDQVPEAARRMGAEPLAERGDRDAMIARMQQTGAVFGAQLGGRYYFAELEGADDGLFAACLVIAFLAQSGKTLAQTRQRCPKTLITPLLELPLASEAHQQVFQQIRTAWAQCPQNTLDGVRVTMDGGWALARTHNGEPTMTFRFESSDWPDLDTLVRHFCDALPELGPQLWNSYHDWAVGNDQWPPGSE